jgi:VanZ family protein
VRAAAAGIIFLAPVYFAGLLFATLIENEQSFYQAYASNVLGAMVGGACEYLSLVLGFKVLVLVTLAFYVATVFAIRATKISARS